MRGVLLRGYSNRFLIRLSDIIFSLTGLILLSPLFLLIAIFIKLDSRGPVIYTQKRVGKQGIDFNLYKFRTMFKSSDRKQLITVGLRDPRITKSGNFLRKYKLDELPQLMNVLMGDMSIVGPRPEVRKYTEMYVPSQYMIVLSVKPGITDIASIEYSGENELLSDKDDPERFYVDEVMPAKIRLNMIYLEKPTFPNYLRIIFRTIVKIVRQ